MVTDGTSHFIQLTVLIITKCCNSVLIINRFTVSKSYEIMIDLFFTGGSIV